MTQAVDSNNDPFAAASMAGQGDKPADPNADPFGTPDEVGGGGGPRGPKWAEILGRLVVLKPIELRKDVPMDPQIDPTPGKTQDIYVTDLTVLGTEPVKVFDPNLNGEGQGGEIEYKTPFTWERWYAYGKGVHIKLEGIEKDPSKKFLLGVVRRCPTSAGYKKGKTWEDAEKEWADYRAALMSGREVAKPQFSWGIVDPTPEQRAVALAWYRGNQ